MDHSFKYDKNPPIEDEILDAIRSGAEPDTILSLLDTMLAETYTYRKSANKLFSAFFKRKNDNLQEITDKTLRSARYFLKTKHSWPAKIKLTYLQKKISFVLDRYPSRGFLSSLCRALDSYLNPKRYNIWKRLEKSGKNVFPPVPVRGSRQSKRSISRGPYDEFDTDLSDEAYNNNLETNNDYDDGYPYENYDDINDQYDDENDEDNDIDFHRQKRYNQSGYKKIRKLNNEKEFEVEDENNDNDDNALTVRQPINNVKRHKRIRVLTTPTDARPNEKPNPSENSKTSKNIKTVNNEEVNPTSESKPSITPDDPTMNDQNTKDAAPEINPDNMPPDNENSNKMAATDKIKDNKNADNK